MNIKELLKHLQSNTGEQLFGEDGKSSANYKRFAAICHPDMNKGSEESIECFKLLQQRVSESTSGIIITSKNNTYEIERTFFAKGDISDLYLTKDKSSILKISRSDNHNSLMDNEFNILKHVVNESKDLTKTLKGFPNITDTFTLGMKNRPKRRVNVIDYDPELISLADIKMAYPRGIDERNFGWIFRRILLGITSLHRCGVVHGAVLPQHFLVNNVEHTFKMIDFIHAVKVGEVVTAQIKDKSFYPKEIVDKTKSSFSTDIYMAGKLGVYLLGGHVSTGTIPGTVSPKLRGFLKAMLIENQDKRPNDAFELHNDFKILLERLFGPPKYVTLIGV